MISFGFETVALRPAVEPKNGQQREPKPSPLMRTTVPPDEEPNVGARALSVGPAPRNVKALGSVAAPFAQETVTSALPAACAGVVAAMDDDVTVPIAAAVPPKVALHGAVKLAPEIVTDVPPAAGPFAGVTELTVTLAEGAVTVTGMLIGCGAREPVT